MAKVQILRVQAYGVGKVSGILDEATRVPDASKHVTAPKPPKWLWGSRDAVDGAVEAHQSQDMQLVHMADGTVHKRKRRKDARCMVAGVASHPLSMMELNQANANGVQAWVKDTLKWLKTRFGKNLKGCLLHLDESHPHLHFFVVGDAQRLHPGMKNEVQGKTRISDSDARMAAHKEGLKAFLDDYHAEVGQHLAHVGRFHRRQRQVVRAGRETLGAERTACGVAVALGAFHHHRVAPTALGESPGAAQSADAAAANGDTHAPRLRRCG